MKDMYADLEKIEARGKRKKEKSKGLFSSFGKKDEPVPDKEPDATEPPKEEPVDEPVVESPKQTAPPRKPVEAAPAQPPQPAAPPRAEAPAPQTWKPLTGGKLKAAEENLLAYKKWLNKGYKSGVLSKEQCTNMVREKEIELGLRPPA